MLICFNKIIGWIQFSYRKLIHRWNYLWLKNFYYVQRIQSLERILVRPRYCAFPRKKSNQIARFIKFDVTLVVLDQTIYVRQKLISFNYCHMCRLFVSSAHALHFYASRIDRDISFVSKAWLFFGKKTHPLKYEG